MGSSAAYWLGGVFQHSLSTSSQCSNELPPRLALFLRTCRPMCASSVCALFCCPCAMCASSVLPLCLVLFMMFCLLFAQLLGVSRPLHAPLLAGASVPAGRSPRPRPYAGAVPCGLVHCVSGQEVVRQIGGALLSADECRATPVGLSVAPPSFRESPLRP